VGHDVHVAAVAGEQGAGEKHTEHTKGEALHKDLQTVFSGFAARILSG
jgi:hypothetical protein